VRVLFYGTPNFAVPSLRALLGEGFDVVGVVTRPDRPTGRHRSTATPSAVKEAARAEELRVLEPDRPADEGFQAAVRELAPDCGAVIAYGHILPEPLLAIPRLGHVNVHASLLPHLRGAAPIERAILEGWTETGISIIRMDAGMDTGPVLHRARTPILPDETGGELRGRLAELGALALVEALTMLDGDGVTAEPQDHAHASYAPKLKPEEERIHWARSAADVARQVRAFDPRPGAWCECRGQALKLFGARPAARTGAPGQVLGAGEALVVACGAGAVEVSDVQPAGKARMTAQAFANGRRIAVGDVLA
jgi:methionyl-tRNA formyltransferase